MCFQSACIIILQAHPESSALIREGLGHGFHSERLTVILNEGVREILEIKKLSSTIKLE